MGVPQPDPEPTEATYFLESGTAELVPAAEAPPSALWSSPKLSANPIIEVTSAIPKASSQKGSQPTERNLGSSSTLSISLPFEPLESKLGSLNEDFAAILEGKGEDCERLGQEAQNSISTIDRASQSTRVLQLGDEARAAANDVIYPTLRDTGPEAGASAQGKGKERKQSKAEEPLTQPASTSQGSSAILDTKIAAAKARIASARAKLETDKVESKSLEAAIASAKNRIERAKAKAARKGIELVESVNFPSEVQQDKRIVSTFLQRFGDAELGTQMRKEVAQTQSPSSSFPPPSTYPTRRHEEPPRITAPNNVDEGTSLRTQEPNLGHGIDFSQMQELQKEQIAMARRENSKFETEIQEARQLRRMSMDDQRGLRLPSQVGQRKQNPRRSVSTIEIGIKGPAEFSLTPYVSSRSEDEDTSA